MRRGGMWSLDCPKCSKHLDYSGDRPVFCAYCGERLPAAADATPRGPDETAEYAPLPDAAPRPPAAPSKVGPYKLGRFLGSGGMGKVYEASDTRTGNEVAVKLLSNQTTATDTAAERFRQEGQLASQISHPNCVFVYAADAEAGRPYIVMELMPGDTLKDLVERHGPLPADEAIPLILDVVEGLREAHRLGVIHRDVKPSNCFLMPDGRVKVGDFGLSKSLDADTDITQSGAFLGTVLYASPEQIRGDAVGYAADTYSVCGTLFYLLTGRAPFKNENALAAVSRIISEDAPRARALRPDVPRNLDRLIAKGLQRDPSRRFRNMDELRADLRALIPGRLTFGGLWARVLAFLADTLVLRLMAAGAAAAAGQDPWLDGGRLTLMIVPVYFLLAESTLGYTFGKWLLRLRVCRAGTTDPPGPARTAVRTALFEVLIFVTLFFPVTAAAVLGLPPAVSAVPFAVGAVLLIAPMRRSNHYRGLHEWLSGTCVMRRPARPQAPRLESGSAGPLESLPPPADGLPVRVGPYRGQGAAATGPGHAVLSAVDAALGRRVVIQLRPAGGAAPPGPRMEVARPGRPRAVGRGTVEVDGADAEWAAYVAPAGTPLPDIVEYGGPLAWPAARPLLEQLADELAASEADGTLPESLHVDQLWVEPTGELRLLDFPVRPAGPAGSAGDPVALLAAAASLMLEGRPRGPGAKPGRVKAPVPRHAAFAAGRLFRHGGYATAAEFRSELATTADRPDDVPPESRLAQVGLQAGMQSIGILLMLMAAALYGVVEVVLRDTYATQADSVGPLVLDPVLRQRIDRQARIDRVEAKNRRRSLTDYEDRLVKEAEADLPAQLSRRVQLDPGAAAADAASHIAHDGGLLNGLGDFWEEALAFLWLWPVTWAVGAAILRGGASFALTGLWLARSDGRKATRAACAVRSMIAWVPFAAVLSAAVVVQALWPQERALRVTLLGVGAGLPVAYLVIATSSRRRTPADRLLGLRVMPA